MSALCLSATGVLVASAPPGGAQAEFVNATVRIDPPLPEPGQDVHVTVRIIGCPPGDTDVEVLLAADQVAGVNGALMGQTQARTSLLWRTRAVIDLPNATQGWYGVRIQCGAYRPAAEPMTATTFAVGANPSNSMAVSARSVRQGGTVQISGNGCPGSGIEYEIAPRSAANLAFSPTGSFATQGGGTWAANVTVPAMDPGPAQVRARCVVKNQLGATVYISYGTPIDLRIEPGS